MATDYLATRLGGRTPRLLVVDGHPVARLGVISLLQETDAFDVVGYAASGREALDAARLSRPDLVVVDAHSLAGGGIEFCRTLRAELPLCRLVVLTHRVDDESAIAAIMAGADAYLGKDASPPQIVEAIARVAAGESVLDPSITGAVLDRVKRRTTEPTDPLSALSHQERSLLRLIARGRTNREMAEELALSPHTVKGYVSAILRKLRVTRRAAAAALLLQIAA